MKNIKRCPVCGQEINRRCVFCVHCGKRFAGTGQDPAITVRKNMGMGPTSAIRFLAPSCHSKTAMAEALGISRNSLYLLIDRFWLHDVKFSGTHAK